MDNKEQKTTIPYYCGDLHVRDNNYAYCSVDTDECGYLENPEECPFNVK